MVILQIALIVTAALVIVPYLIVPALVYRKQRINANPRVVPVQEAEVPFRVQDYFAAVTRQLGKLGFESHIDGEIRHFSPDQRWFVRFFTNYNTRQTAVAIDLTQMSGEAPSMEIRFVEFTTQYRDGSEVCVSNSNLLRQPGTAPYKKIVYVPDSTDLGRLYALHHQLSLYFGKGEPGILPPPGGELASMQQLIIQDLQSTVESGYQRFDEAEQTYMLTWKGAYIATWMSMWPMRDIRLVMARKNAERLLSLCTPEELAARQQGVTHAPQPQA